MTQYQLHLIKHNENLMFCSMFKSVSKGWSCQCTMNNPSDKKGISKVCLGNHQSRIETGRQKFLKSQNILEFDLDAT